MPNRISKTTKKAVRDLREKRDSNQIAFATIQKTIDLSEADERQIDKATISAVMSVLGRIGGKIGGKRRLETMSDQERSDSALKAAHARWAKKNKED